MIVDRGQRPRGTRAERRRVGATAGRAGASSRCQGRVRFASFIENSERPLRYWITLARVNDVRRAIPAVSDSSHSRAAALRNALRRGRGEGAFVLLEFGKPPLCFGLHCGTAVVEAALQRRAHFGPVVGH
jgi:hypothetical protein